jgi:hypothetical protein
MQLVNSVKRISKGFRRGDLPSLSICPDCQYPGSGFHSLVAAVSNLDLAGNATVEAARPVSAAFAKPKRRTSNEQDRKTNCYEGSLPGILAVTELRPSVGHHSTMAYSFGSRGQSL